MDTYSGDDQRRMRVEAEETIQEARRIWDYLTPILARMTARDARFALHYRQSMLNWQLGEAIHLTRADMANLQLVNPVSGALEIAAQRGFHQPFLDFFRSVRDEHTACGAALRYRQAVVVPDVADSPIFWGTPALEAVLDAGVRAVQSAPLLGADGSVLGVISTHWRSPRRLDCIDLPAFERLAANIAHWLDQRRDILLL